MATREENLKKINDELELMSDEELDAVAGGNVGQTVLDSIFLYEHGIIDDWHGEFHTMFNWNSDSKEVDAGWAKAGITCVTKPNEDNQYFKDGKQIRRFDAINHLKANFKQIREVSAIPL